MEPQKVYESFLDMIETFVQDGTLSDLIRTVDLQPETHLNELGLDSISQVALLTGLMEITDSYLPDNLFLGNPSLWEIAQCVSNNIEP